jgi:cell division protein FtsB
MIKRYFFIIIVILTLIAITIFYYRYQEIDKYRKNMYALDKEIERLKEINEQLSGRLKALKNDSLAIEKLLRNKHGLVKRGEVVIDIEELEEDGKAKPKKNRRRERGTVNSQ